MKYYIDPPSGWRYGFPKVYDETKDGTIEEFLIKNGYPKKDIEFAVKYTRYWKAKDDSDEEK
jgi:hypothetical protein